MQLKQALGRRPVEVSHPKLPKARSLLKFFAEGGHIKRAWGKCLAEKQVVSMLPPPGLWQLSAGTPSRLRSRGSPGPLSEGIAPKLFYFRFSILPHLDLRPFLGQHAAFAHRATSDAR